MRIFLDHGEAYGNLGDDAMLIAAHRRILAALGEVEFIVPCRGGGRLPALSNTQFIESARLAIPEAIGRLKRFHWIGWLGRLRQPYLQERWVARRERLLSGSSGWQVTTEALSRSDALYAVGCGNMNDIAPHVTLLYRSALYRAARHRGVPIITSSQGVGPLRHRWSQAVASRICACSSHFSLRAPLAPIDEGARMDRVGRAPVVGDEAYFLPAAGEAQWARLLQGHGVRPGSPYLVIHYRAADYVGDIGSPLEALAEGLRHLAFDGHHVFVPMSVRGHSGSDVAVGEKLRTLLGKSVRFANIEPLQDPSLAKALVWRSSGVVALSYHLQVFALSGAIPFVILTQGRYYFPKASGMRLLAGTKTPLLDLSIPEAATARVVLAGWMAGRAAQIADLRASQRRIEPINTMPVEALLHHLHFYDKSNKRIQHEDG